MCCCGALLALCSRVWLQCRCAQGNRCTLLPQGPDLTGDPACLQLSTENAAAIKAALQTPLLVDPNATAAAWLRAHATASAKAGAVEFASMHDARLSKTLELALRFGKTLVISGAGAISPILVSTLRREFLARGTRRAVVVGDKAVDVDEDFRLVLVTGDAEVGEGGAAGGGGVSPDLQPLMTVANFTTTRAGLQAQLLAATLQHEQPQLEQQRMCARQHL